MMIENFEIKEEFLENLKSVIEFREEVIILIKKVLENSESNDQSKNGINNLIEKILTEFSIVNQDFDENKLLLLKNTLGIIFEKQMVNSKLANRLRKNQISDDTLDFLSKLE